MHIILGKSNARDLEVKYTVLELDMIKFDREKPPEPAFVVLENIPLEELSELDHYTHLHAKLVENYRKKNWNFCEQAIEHLLGRWGQSVDSFYQELRIRVDKYKKQDPGEDWDYTIHKY